MVKQAQSETPNEGDFETAYDYFEFALRELKKLADEAEDEKIRLRAVAHIARISASLLR